MKEFNKIYDDTQFFSYKNHLKYLGFLYAIISAIEHSVTKRANTFVRIFSALISLINTNTNKNGERELLRAYRFAIKLQCFGSCFVSYTTE